MSRPDLAQQNFIASMMINTTRRFAKMRDEAIADGDFYAAVAWAKSIVHLRIGHGAAMANWCASNFDYVKSIGVTPESAGDAVRNMMRL